MNTTTPNQTTFSPFYDVIVSNPAEDVHMTARVRRNGKFDARIMRDGEAYITDDAGMLPTFVRRSYEKAKTNRPGNFTIEFQYKEHRQKYKVYPSGVLLCTHTQRVLNDDGSMTIKTTVPEHPCKFDGDIDAKFEQMISSILGYIKLINSINSNK